jgi:ribosome biogenesis GTPase / thiamine phosphate phosphatase
LNKGTIVKTTGSWHTVRYGNTFVQCRLKGSLRTKDLKNTNPVAVGDLVTFEPEKGNCGIITAINPRKNYIIRRATNLSRESQIMAANIDQVLLMVTLKYPETPLEFIDRFILTAEAYHIPCILIINKIDLYSAKMLTWLEEVKKIYAFAGYNSLELSVKSNYNIDKILEYMHNKLSLIAGNSGVGKTSLINYLCPGLNLKTNEISRYHSTGKHTTTYPEMIEIADNSYVIDSPGIRGFGITDMNKSEIGLYFTDIFRLSKNCQFNNCTHIHEPDCAVIKAYNDGILHESRYRSYFKLFTDNGLKYRIT